MIETDCAERSDQRIHAVNKPDRTIELFKLVPCKVMSYLHTCLLLISNEIVTRAYKCTPNPLSVNGSSEFDDECRALQILIYSCSFCLQLINWIRFK